MVGSARGEPVGRWLAPQLVVLVTFVAFLPALQNDFVSWDDEPNLVENLAFRGLRWTNLHWMLTTTHMGHWIPLTWLSFGADYVVWGMDPFGYHLTNLLLHVAGAAVFFLVALRLLEVAQPRARESALLSGAFAAALFFAIHPLRVESVAWVTERRDVLSGLWFLLTILLYLRAVALTGLPRRSWLAGSIACYGLAVVSKAIVMTLPVVLVVLDLYPLRRLKPQLRDGAARATRGVWLEKVPYALLALGAVTMAIHAQGSHAEPLAQRPLGGRVAAALYGLWFYLWKTLIPAAISPLYEIPRRVDPLAPSMVASAAAVVAITVAFLLLRRRWPAGLAAWVSYVVLLAPVSGLTQSGPQLVAARYSYLSCLGWALLAGGAVSLVADRLASGRLNRLIGGLVTILIAACIVVLGALTWRQTRVWRDSQTLWSHTVSLQPTASLAHNNLGSVLLKRSRLEEAEFHIRKAAHLHPELEEAQSNLASVLQMQGRPEEARETRIRLGHLFLRHGKPDRAIEVFQKDAAAQSGDAVAHNNLGVAWFVKGDFSAASEHFERALQIDADFEEARRNLLEARSKVGRAGKVDRQPPPP